MPGNQLQDKLLKANLFKHQDMTLSRLFVIQAIATFVTFGVLILSPGTIPAQFGLVVRATICSAI